jgi:hypothetical protein
MIWVSNLAYPSICQQNGVCAQEHKVNARDVYFCVTSELGNISSLGTRHYRTINQFRSFLENVH